MECFGSGGLTLPLSLTTMRYHNGQLLSFDTLFMPPSFHLSFADWDWVFGAQDEACGEMRTTLSPREHVSCCAAHQRAIQLALMKCIGREVLTTDEEHLGLLVDGLAHC